MRTASYYRNTDSPWAVTVVRGERGTGIPRSSFWKPGRTVRFQDSHLSFLIYSFLLAFHPIWIFPTNGSVLSEEGPNRHGKFSGVQNCFLILHVLKKNDPVVPRFLKSSYFIIRWFKCLLKGDAIRFHTCSQWLLVIPTSTAMSLGGSGRKVLFLFFFF